MQAYITAGYCWSSHFHARRLRLPHWILVIFGPSTKACPRHDVRHLGFDQQYPAVNATGWSPLPQGEPGCRTTHGKNLCPLGSFVTGFSTCHTLLAFYRNNHTPYQILVAGASGGRHGASRFFAPSCPLPCSPTHRGIGLGVLTRALAGLLDLFPVLGVLGLKFRDTVLVPGDPHRPIRGMHRGLGVVVPLFLALAYEHTYDGHVFGLLLARRTTGRLPPSPARHAPLRLEVHGHPLRPLRGGGDGVRGRRGEVEELMRERRDELIDNHLQRHQGSGPPLRVHDGDMPVRTAQHLL